MNRDQVINDFNRIMTTVFNGASNVAQVCTRSHPRALLSFLPVIFNGALNVVHPLAFVSLIISDFIAEAIWFAHFPKRNHLSRHRLAAWPA